MKRGLINLCKFNTQHEKINFHEVATVSSVGNKKKKNFCEIK